MGQLSMIKIMDLYEPMIQDYMDQELYQIDTREDLNARGMQLIRMKTHLRLQYKIMYKMEHTTNELEVMQ